MLPKRPCSSVKKGPLSTLRTCREEWHIGRAPLGEQGRTQHTEALTANNGTRQQLVIALQLAISASKIASGCSVLPPGNRPAMPRALSLHSQSNSAMPHGSALLTSRPNLKFMMLGAAKR